MKVGVCPFHQSLAPLTNTSFRVLHRFAVTVQQGMIGLNNNHKRRTTLPTAFLCLYIDDAYLWVLQVK